MTRAISSLIEKGICFLVRAMGLGKGGKITSYHFEVAVWEDTFNDERNKWNSLVNGQIKDIFPPATVETCRT